MKLQVLFPVLLALTGCLDWSIRVEMEDVPTDGGGDSDSDTDSDSDSDGDSPSGVCTNATDMAAVQREDYGTAGDQSYADVTAGCGRECALDTDPDVCALICLQTGTENAASDECAGCYVAQVMCAIMNCLARCMADPAGADCFDCRCGDNPDSENCMGDFEFCSGFPPSTPCTFPKEGLSSPSYARGSRAARPSPQ